MIGLVFSTLASLALLFVGLLASPFVYGYAMRYLGLSLEGGVALLTGWMWTVLYWGTFFHAKKVTRLFERIENATKN